MKASFPSLSITSDVAVPNPVSESSRQPLDLNDSAAILATSREIRRKRTQTSSSRKTCSMK